MLIKPYYDHAGITIYHGDCLEILPELGQVDCVITDPPYGYSYSSSWGASWKNTVIKNDDSTFVRDKVLSLIPEIPWACFGSWRVRPPKETKTVLVWDKGPASGMGDLSIPWKCSFELICIGGVGWYGKRDEGVLRGHVVPPSEPAGRRHPNEKPVSLIAALLRKAPYGIVFDPFMGSGTTLRAAKDLGRRAIGIEIEERYCEIAAKRLSQEVLPL
jgi:DNA modification methylase